MITRRFTRAELADLDEDMIEYRSAPWRHGRRVDYVFPAEGAHWMVTLNVHHEEGWDCSEEGVLAMQVRQVEKVVKAWEPVGE